MPRLGEIKRNPAKVSAAFRRQKNYHVATRRLHVTVDVRRYSRWIGQSITKSREDYQADACVAISPKATTGQGAYRMILKRKWGDNRCGVAHGKTPTAAMKKALAALSRKLK